MHITILFVLLLLILKEKSACRSRNFSISGCSKGIQEQYYIGGNDSINDSPKEREKCVIRAKLTAAK